MSEEQLDQCPAFQYPEFAGDALEFLATIKPSGVWSLVSISTEGKITGKSFDPKSTNSSRNDVAARGWLEQKLKTQNLYYTAGNVAEFIDRKCSKSDISSVAMLWADLDPRAGEDHETELDRMWRMVTHDLPGQLPPPSFAIKSGNGIQLGWLLKEPVSTDDEPARQEIELRNKYIAQVLDGDESVCNVDRILRLPGTRNIPNAKKRAAGKSEHPTGILWLEESRIYSLEEFPKLENPVRPVSSEHVVVIDESNTSRHTLEELMDRYSTVRDTCWVKITHGYDPDAGPKPASRSEDLFGVCIELIKNEVPDDVVYSIITDPRHGISESVVDKGPNVQKYALRQISRAHEEITKDGDSLSPTRWLNQLNDRYCVIGNYHGKCRIIEEVYDPLLEREQLTHISFSDFRNFMCNQYVQTDADTKKPVGDWWLRHPARNQRDTVVFAPDRELNNAYNLWRGWAFDPKPGENHRLFMEHVFENICSGNEEHYEYVVNWMARAVQHPARQGETAIVMRGQRGTGKSIFATVFGALFGRHFIQVSDPKHLVGSFNLHLRDCIVVFGDEAFYAGDKRHESVLKTLITEEHFIIEPKGVDARSAPNCTHLILASNSDWVVPAGEHERRFLVLDVSDRRRQDTAYFGEVKNLMEHGGYASLLHFLKSHDITEFDHRNVPKTKALRDQQRETSDQFAQVMLDAAESGELPLPQELRWKPNGKNRTADLLNSPHWPFLHHQFVHDYMVDEFQKVGRGVLARRTISVRLGKLFGSRKTGAIKNRTTDLQYVYPVGSLTEFRQRVLTYLGWEDFEWPEEISDWQPYPPPDSAQGPF